jgi:hypothetical protein
MFMKRSGRMCLKMLTRVPLKPKVGVTVMALGRMAKAKKLAGAKETNYTLASQRITICNRIVVNKMEIQWAMRSVMTKRWLILLKSGSRRWIPISGFSKFIFHQDPHKK